MIEKLLNLKHTVPDNYHISDPRFFLKYAVNDVISNTKYAHGTDYATYAKKMIDSNLAATDTTTYTVEYARAFEKVYKALTE